MVRPIQRYVLLEAVNSVMAQIIHCMEYEDAFLTGPLRSVPAHRWWLVSLDAMVHDALIASVDRWRA